MTTCNCGSPSALGATDTIPADGLPGGLTSELPGGLTGGEASPEPDDTGEGGELSDGVLPGFSELADWPGPALSLG